MTAKNMPSQPPPSFGTVLVARTPHQSPSGLELQMRHHSSRLRVVEKLSGGAHLLLPGSDSTIAVRAYYPKVLERFDDSEDSRHERLHDDGTIPDIDGIQAFRKAFKYSIIFCVCPPGPLQTKQASGVDSFFQHVQRLMNGTASQTEQVRDAQGSARAFLVTDVASAVDILRSLLDTLKSEKRETKKRYYEQLAARLFVPSNKTAGSAHVSEAIRNWCEHLSLPPGEGDVLMSLMKTLPGIVEPDDAALEDVPVEDTTKQILQTFFRSPGGEGVPHSGGGQSSITSVEGPPVPSVICAAQPPSADPPGSVYQEPPFADWRGGGGMFQGQQQQQSWTSNPTQMPLQYGEPMSQWQQPPPSQYSVHPSEQVAPPQWARPPSQYATRFSQAPPASSSYGNFQRPSHPPQQQQRFANHSMSLPTYGMPPPLQGGIPQSRYGAPMPPPGARMHYTPSVGNGRTPAVPQSARGHYR